MFSIGTSILILSSSITLISRIGYYFSIVIVVLLGNILFELKSKQKKFIMVVILCLLSIFLYFSIYGTDVLQISEYTTFFMEVLLNLVEVE